MSELISICVPFAGFYESIHDSILDEEVSLIASDDNGNESHEAFNLAYSLIDFAAVKDDYAETYVSYLSKEVGIALDFETLESPLFYNYATDRIFAKGRLEDFEKFKEDESVMEIFKELAEERFTSRDGFISHYDPDIKSWGNMKRWDHNQLGCFLEAILIEEDGKEWELDVFEQIAGNYSLSAGLSDDAYGKICATRDAELEGI